MARVQYEEAVSQMNNDNSIGFFSLKNDGDEAVVRIMHDSTRDFDIITTHSVDMGQRFPRKVSCIRESTDPINSCPFCAASIPVKKSIFIHLIQYTKNPDGSITAEPKVWERSISYANQLRDLLLEYGPLSDQIFKIRRNGAPGSVNTTYSILYANPQMYNATNYPKDVNAFTGYSALGRVVLDKSYTDMECFLTTGQFPQKSLDTVQTQQHAQQDQQRMNINDMNAVLNEVVEHPVAPQISQPVFQQPVQHQYATPQVDQTNAASPYLSRPVRHY